jgi:uncharacterized membrane protein YphA (DoxX/SURF4 family)/peroxiredoxin
MKSITQLFRLLVGILFIASGLIKANDPLGLAYKMDEYFAVWNWDWTKPYTLYLSLAMNTMEIVAGVALLIGWAPRFFSRFVLLLIVFFTFLTGYAVLSGKIKTCGCFGDCIPLQAWQSFAKDLVLLFMTLVLVINYKYINSLLPIRAALFLVLFSAGFVFWGQMNVLKHLPYVDCLPYKAGNNLLEKMQPPPGSIPDSVAIFYKYKYNGKEVTFDAMHFPDDFSEDKYEYVSREEKIVRKGNAEPAIKDLALYGLNGEDTTKAVLQTNGRYLLFFAKDFSGETPEWLELWSKIYLKANEKKVPVILLSNQPVAARRFFNETNHFNVPVLSCDGTVMKTMLRSKTGVVAMDGATVAAKWSEADMNDVIRWLNQP